MLVREGLGFVDDDVLARRIALVDDCRVEDCEMLAGLDAWLDVECSMSVYLSRRGCRRSVNSSGSVLSRKKWKNGGSPIRHGSHPFLHCSLVCEHRACCRSSLLFVVQRVASWWRDCRCGRSLLVVLGAKLFVHRTGGSW